MKERPIIFNTEMVRAILGGRKTQTRRPIKIQPPVCYTNPFHYDSGVWFFRSLRNPYDLWRQKRGVTCPFGYIGDYLWVRETWRLLREPLGVECPQSAVSVQYKATEDSKHWRHWKVVASATDDLLPNGWSKFDRRIGEHRGFLVTKPVPWTPSIHMLRWASRITLEITGVRVERVQDISEEDAKAEGVRPSTWYAPFGKGEEFHRDISGLPGFPDERISYRNGFATRWDSIYAARGLGWDKNPWVWVIHFKVVERKAPAA